MQPPLCLRDPQTKSVLVSEHPFRPSSAFLAKTNPTPTAVSSCEMGKGSHRHDEEKLLTCSHRRDQTGLAMFHHQHKHRSQMGALLIVLCALAHVPFVAAMRTPMRTSSASASPSRPGVRRTNSRTKLSRVSHDIDPCPVVFAQLQRSLSDLTDIETPKDSHNLSWEESLREESLRENLRRSPTPSSWFAELYSECDSEHAEEDASRVSTLAGSNVCFLAASRMDKIVTSVAATTITPGGLKFHASAYTSLIEAPDIGTLMSYR